VAVIGSGIAGLTAAYLLSRRHEVHVFEADGRIGGHTHTVTVETPDGPVAVDTGFIVHNPVRYPNFLRLMAELGVPTAASDMSFAFHGRELEWCSRGLNGVLTQRRNLFDPRFWSLWREVARFNHAARRLVREEHLEGTMGAFLDGQGFSDSFRRHYLYPMAGAIWSTEVAAMEAFPAVTLARFLDNHGMLGFTTQVPWRTIEGGTSRYLEPLTRTFRERIRTGVSIQNVRRAEGRVAFDLEGEGCLSFDEVVLAVHGDQVLGLLQEPKPIEQEVFAAFRSNRHDVWLHCDTSVFPRQRRAWASWNYRETGDKERLLLTYHMNRLQPLHTTQDLLVSLDASGLVDEQRVLRRFIYEHPRYDLPTERSRARWADVSGTDRLHYAGAYWGFGFHEDGVVSGMKVAECLGVQW
jgi:predicted NAD/FAD-binding protein